MWFLLTHLNHSTSLGGFLLTAQGRKANGSPSGLSYPPVCKFQQRPCCLRMVQQHRLFYPAGSLRYEELLKFKNFQELKDLEKEIKVFEEEDKIIEKKLEQRRISHEQQKAAAREAAALEAAAEAAARAARERSPHQEISSTVRSPHSPSARIACKYLLYNPLTHLLYNPLTPLLPQ